jgi:hypothetical protein
MSVKPLQGLLDIASQSKDAVQGNGLPPMQIQSQAKKGLTDLTNIAKTPTLKVGLPHKSTLIDTTPSITNLMGQKMG